MSVHYTLIFLPCSIFFALSFLLLDRAPSQTAPYEYVQFPPSPALPNQFPDCHCVFVCVSTADEQGIDRSHSWVNSAYAPGGSRAVLRRNPNSSCELKQVLNFPLYRNTTLPINKLYPNISHSTIVWNVHLLPY